MKPRIRKMNFKTLVATSLLAILAAGLIGCNDNDDNFDPPPATPQGVYSITGDGVIWVYWNGIYEKDVRQYIIYRSLQSTTGYVEVGRVNAESNPNLDLLIYEYPDRSVTNGTTYYYAISSVDHAGQESALSAENVYDTPRPEGSASMFPAVIDPTIAGFNFETGSVVNWQSAIADVYVDSSNGFLFLNAANDTVFIQDMGYTSNFDEISWAPTDGWLQLLDVELVLGHTYVVRTQTPTHFYYSKLRVTSVNVSGSVSFDWGWQSDPDNPELTPKLNDAGLNSGVITIEKDGRVQTGS